MSGSGRDQVFADLQECMRLAVAGACQYTVAGKHAYLRDIMAIGDKYGRDALGELDPSKKPE